MKDLSIEEKARCYDKAVNEIRNLRDMLLKEGVINKEGIICDNFNRIFLELKESEDEKMRNGLIIYLRSILSNKKYGDKFIEDWIVWLEKIGEHLKFCKTIQIGDRVTRNEGGVLVNMSQLDRIAKKRKKQGEQKSVDKVEPKFKVGDVVTNKKSKDTVKIVQILHDSYCYSGWDGASTVHSDFSISEQDDWELVELAAWSEEDETEFNHIIKILNSVAEEQETKGYNNLIGSVNWLKSLKDRVQSKQEILEKLEEWLDEYVSDLADVDTASLICSFTNYLDGKSPKSLRPQSHWKPSEEQLKSLKEVIDVGHFTSYPNALEILYEQLKKLRGE